MFFLIDKSPHKSRQSAGNIPAKIDPKTLTRTPHTTKLPTKANELAHISTESKKQQHEDLARPLHNNNDKSQHPDTLVLSDSILKGAAPLIKTKYQNIDIRVLPGAKIQDCSRYLTSVEWLPEKILFNIGSNNIRGARTINHIVRPLWYTIEAAQKRFQQREWFVNSIPYRIDVRDKHIDDLNLALQDLCMQLGAHYLDTTQHISDDCYGFDGIHLNDKGAHKMAELLHHLLKTDQNKPYPDPTQNQDKPNGNNNSEDKRINEGNFSTQPTRTDT